MHHWNWRAVYNVFSEMQFERGRQSVKARVNASCLSILYLFRAFFFHIFIHSVLFISFPFCVFNVCDFLRCAHLVFGLYGYFVVAVVVVGAFVSIFLLFLFVHLFNGANSTNRRHCAHCEWWHCCSALFLSSIYRLILCVAIKQIEEKSQRAIHYN